MRAFRQSSHYHCTSILHFLYCKADLYKCILLLRHNMEAMLLARVNYLPVPTSSLLQDSPAESVESHLINLYGTCVWWFTTARFPIQSRVGIIIPSQYLYPLKWYSLFYCFFKNKLPVCFQYLIFCLCFG